MPGLAIRTRGNRAASSPGEGGGGGEEGGEEGGGGELGGTTPGTHPNGLLAAGHNIAVNGEKEGGGYQTAAFFDYPQGVINLTNIVQVAVGSGTPIMLDDNGRIYTLANGETGNAGIGDASVSLYDATHVTGGVQLYPQQDIPTKGVNWRQVRGPIGPTLPTKADHEAGRSTWHIVAVDSAASHSLALTSDGRVLAWASNNGGALGNGWESGAAGDSKRAHDEKLRTTLGAELSTGGPITSLTVAPTEKGQSYEAGQQVIVETVDNLHRWEVTLSETIEGGATTLPINSATPSFAFPVGAIVALPVYPQMSPWWVQTGGPAQSETGKHARGMSLVSGVEGTPSAVYAYDAGWGSGTGANILTGVSAVVACEHVSFYLKGDSVYYSGSPSGKGKTEPGAVQLYAEKDPVWDPTNPEHLPVGFHVIAIAATRGGYLLLLSNGTVSENVVRWVGNNERYAAGNGSEKSATSTTREVLKPTLVGGAEPKGVVAIAKGEYSLKLLKSDGTVWTAGDNFLYQQGLGAVWGASKWGSSSWGVPVNVPHVTQILAVNDGGRKAIALSSTGEQVLGPSGFFPGVNGGDMTAVLLDNHKTLCVGIGFVPSTGAGEHWEGVGSFGLGHSDHAIIPTAPLGDPSNVRQVCAGPVNTYFLQEPGEPATPSLRVTCPSPGSVLVAWSPPTGAVGQLPNLRAPEGYEVKLTRPGFAALSVKVTGATREHLFTGVAPGEWTAIVNETLEAVEPTITSGASLLGGVYVGKGSGGKLALGWTKPPGKLIDRYILEWRHKGTYLNAKGVATAEDWIRVTPDVVGSATSTVLAITPSEHGIAGEEVELRLYDYFSGRKGQTEGAYKKRQRSVLVT